MNRKVHAGFVFATSRKLINRTSLPEAACALLAIVQQHLDGLGVPGDVEMAKLGLRRLLQAIPEKSSAHRDATGLLKKIEDQLL